MPNTSSSERTPLQAHLEAIARNGLRAINARVLHPTSEPWRYFHDDLQYTTCEVHDGTENVIPTNPLKTKPQSLTTWLEYQRRLASTHQEYDVHILDTACVDVSDNDGYGSVVVNTMVSGIPKGVTRAFVMVFDLRRDKDTWKVYKFSSVGGESMVT